MKKLLSVLSFVFIFSAFSDNTDRIVKFLNKMDIGHKVTDSGSILIRDGDLLIFIDSHKSAFKVEQIRIIAVMKHDGGLTHDMMNRMLQINLTAEACWCIADKNHPAYKLVLPVNCSEDSFALALLACVDAYKNFDKRIVRGEK